MDLWENVTSWLGSAAAKGFTTAKNTGHSMNNCSYLGVIVTVLFLRIGSMFFQNIKLPQDLIIITVKQSFQFSLSIKTNKVLIIWSQFWYVCSLSKHS